MQLLPDFFALLYEQPVMIAFAVVLVVGLLLLAVNLWRGKRLEKKLRLQQPQPQWQQDALRLTAFEAMAALVILDNQWQVVEVNAAFIKMSGFTAGQLIGQPFDQLFDVGQPLQGQINTMLSAATPWQGELNCRHANGEAHPQLSIFSPLLEGGVLRYIVGNFVDLAEQKRQEPLSLRDPLTSVWNRRKLNEIVDSEIARQERHHQPFALAVIDLDYFGQINENYGHDVGDELLQRVVKLFSHALRRSDLLAWVGGEEFVVFFPQTEREGAHKMLERLRLALAESEQSPPVTCSIGLACYHPGDSRKSLQRRADEALDLAKSNGRNRVVFADAG